MDFRKNAAILAGEINRDLPDFTVHDVSHLDALWDTADQILGSSYELTPTEAFVFGGAVLLHDLGLGTAAYPDGPGSLETGDRWIDALTVVLQNRLDRHVTDEDRLKAGEDAKREARATLLRELHALHAEQLALISWPHRGTTMYLLEREELRRAYGRIIGRVAHSHWWSVEDLRTHLNQQMSPPPEFPATWTVDVLKVACMLRTADACQVDSRRAPRLLSAVRRPAPDSQEHWTFQEKLHQPRVAGDRFEYHAGEGFAIEEAPAWWLCLDLLRLADRELRGVDALLSDLGRGRFQIRGVSKVDSPDRLAADVPPVGWAPVDATVQIGDVAGLVRMLGGKELYGDNRTVVVRELIQNAMDAVRARRIADTASPSGTVVVRLDECDQGHWLEVTDTGVGMSPNVLTGMLLDFGRSLWSSPDILSELPGLVGQGFRSIGRFGIGFFSIFMLGERVEVTSRRFERARADTLVLEFKSGVRERPIVRPAAEAEQLADGGTRVRVLLDQEPTDDGGLLDYVDGPITLRDLVTHTAPAPSVDLYVREAATNVQIGLADDWLTVDGEILLARLRSLWRTSPVRHEERVPTNLREVVEDDGTVVGRAAIVPFDSSAGGTPVVGGLRAGGLTGIAGLLVAETTRASRDEAVPVASPAALARWASEQADLVPALTAETRAQFECASVIARLGGQTAGLPILRTADGFLSHEEAVAWLTRRERVVFFEEFELSGLPSSFVLDDDAAGFESASLGLLSSPRWTGWPETLHEVDRFYALSRAAAVAVGEAWGLDLAEVAARAEWEERPAVTIATVKGEPAQTSSYTLFVR